MVIDCHAERKAARLRRQFFGKPPLTTPLTAATLRLLVAAPVYRLGPPADAEPLLNAVTTAPGLPTGHPLKVAALLQQANQFASRGDLEGARRLFEQTGSPPSSAPFSA